MLIKLHEICVKRHDSTSYFPVNEHPYYLSLKNDNRDIYESYIVKSFYQYSKSTGSWYGFKQLYKNIKHNGFHCSKEPIVIKHIEGKWVCVNGRHRICILYKIFGPHVLMKVVNNNLISFKEYDETYEQIITLLV
jgi:hypothetical protein